MNRATAGRTTGVAALVAVVLLLLAAAGGGSPASASPGDGGDGGGSSAAVPVPAVPVAPRAARAGEEDFAFLPTRCRQNADDEICRLTRYQGRPFVVVWGDSHALMYSTAMRAKARQHTVNLVVAYSGSCPVSVPFPRRAGETWATCDRHNDRVLDYVRDLDRGHRVRVVIGGNWAGYRATYAALQRAKKTGKPSGVDDYHAHMAILGVRRSEQAFRALRRAGVRADVIAQAATVPPNRPACAAGVDPYQCDLRRAAAMPDEAATARFLARRTALLPRGARTIDPSPTYCGPDVCRAHVGRVNTWWDDLHLGQAATRAMRPYFEPTFAAVARPRR